MIRSPLRRAILAGALTGIALTTCVVTAHAQFVSITGPQVDLNAVEAPEPDATFVDAMNQTFTITFNQNQQFTNGNVSSGVFRRANGFLDFVYQVNVTTATGGVSAINLTDFGDFTTDGGFREDIDIDGDGPFTEGGKEPFRAGRPSDGGLQFTFNSSGEGSIDSGQKSTVLVIRTNATNYTFGTGAVSAQASGNVLIFAPTNLPGIVVPETNTLALVLPGLAMLGAMIAYRHATVIKRRKLAYDFLPSE